MRFPHLEKALKTNSFQFDEEIETNRRKKILQTEATRIFKAWYTSVGKTMRICWLFINKFANDFFLDHRWVSIKEVS